MKQQFLRRLACATLLACAPGASESRAAVILALDFGAGGAYNGTNTPAHADGAVTGNLLFSEPSSTNSGTIGNFTYDFGRGGTESGSDGKTAEYVRNVATTSNASGTGIFATTLSDDAVFDIAPGFRRDPVAIRLNGFVNGNYTAYLVAHYGAVNFTQSVGFILNSNGTTTDFDDIPGNQTISLTPDVDTGNWTGGFDYAKFNFSITGGATQNITFMANNLNNGGTALEHKASFSSLVIVDAIPEPTSALLMAVAGLWLCARSRRRA